MTTSKKTTKLEIIKKDIGIIGVLWLAVLFSISLYGAYYTWDKTTPEKLSDPIVWVLEISVLLIYLVGRLIKII